MIGMIRRLALSLLATVAIAFPVQAAEQSMGYQTKPSLYFLVVDKSGSIKHRNLTEKIKTEIKTTFNDISRLNQNTVVRTLLFSDRYEKVKWMSRLFRGFLCFWVSNELITIPLMRQRL